jgi:glycosyltransferase involved in cell wall biosynthesis
VFDVHLPWSMAFLYRLIRALDGSVHQSVVTRLIENRERFPEPDVDTVRSPALIRPEAALRTAEDIRVRRMPDVLHAHMGYSAMRSLLLKHMLGVPMVVTFGGADLDNRTGEPAIAALYDYMFRHVEQFVAVSDDLRERLIALGCPTEKAITVYRGVDPDAFPVVDRQGRSGRVHILMVGRLVPKKGHLAAIEALRLLRERRATFSCTIVGAGPMEDDLHQAIRSAGLEDIVSIRPPGDRQYLKQCLERADMLLHPSVTTDTGDREGVPNVIYEAQGTGLPVVATRHGGIPEVVVDGETGLLVPERAPDALAEAGLSLADESVRLRMGRAGARRVRARFTMDAQARAYADIYRRLAPQCGEDTIPREPLPALLRKGRRAWWRWTEPSFSDLAEARNGVLTGLLGMARRLVPAQWRKRIKRLAADAAPGILDRAGRAHAEEDDRFWDALGGSRPPALP